MPIERSKSARQQNPEWLMLERFSDSGGLSSTGLEKQPDQIPRPSRPPRCDPEPLRLAAKTPCSLSTDVTLTPCPDRVTIVIARSVASHLRVNRVRGEPYATQIHSTDWASSTVIHGHCPR